ncbi:Nucleotide-binding universal stress protein, UspA family [Ekhidna lutea]|uniref:Nucleotide-binding universal stress protein, UspA family n=1 Tax=Ekhidna lutea TaxID=447679 RepID=A0A239LBU0_EKHLU|nr:universal stress protein [Ekhidna lutea]SNT27775.1 Nucleotide-binding universal stress protein, UspA family [Ekhidna lutea]
MKKIIVPIDFSEEASHALNFAIEFNERVKGEIVLVHVVEMPVGHLSFMGEVNTSGMESFYTGEYLKATHNKLDEWAKRPKDAGHKVHVHMKSGNAFTNISKLIAEENAGWIIMGSKGASGIREVFIGSNAERMIRHAECPVIIIKGETHLKDMKSMAFASDLSAEQDLIAYKAKEIQELLGLNMHVVKVKTPYNWLEEVQVKKRLEQFAERNHLKDYSISTVEAEFVDEGAVQFANEVNAGLIVMGTHGKKGIAHLIGGSITEDVVNESKIPILVYKILA